MSRTGRCVPTWNCRAVHVTGVPRLLYRRGDQDDMLDRLAADNEGEDGCRPSDTGPQLYENLIRGIVCFELPVAMIEAKARLAQDKPEEDREGVREHALYLIR